MSATGYPHPRPIALASSSNQAWYVSTTFFEQHPTTITHFVLPETTGYSTQDSNLSTPTLTSHTPVTISSLRPILRRYFVQFSDSRSNRGRPLKPKVPAHQHIDTSSLNSKPLQSANEMDRFDFSELAAVSQQPLFDNYPQPSTIKRQQVSLGSPGPLPYFWLPRRT